VKISLKDY
jgi:hypothetical protein